MTAPRTPGPTTFQGPAGIQVETKGADHAAEVLRTLRLEGLHPAVD